MGSGSCWKDIATFHLVETRRNIVNNQRSNKQFIIRTDVSSHSAKMSNTSAEKSDAVVTYPAQCSTF